MISGKHNSSDSSSEEIDHQEKHNDTTSGGSGGGSIGWSYVCAFCKRGFTNAQALGGHMNMHRKDRAKAKKKNQGLSLLVNKNSHEEFKAEKCFAPILNNRGFHGSSLKACKNYQLPYSSSSKPSYLHTCKQFDLFSPEKDHVIMHGYRLMDQKLNITMALPPGEGGEERKSDRINPDVDLELRLAQYP